MYRLKINEDIGAGDVVWEGARRPTRTEVDSVALSCARRGWNGLEIVLYRDEVRVEELAISESCLEEMRSL